MAMSPKTLLSPSIHKPHTQRSRPHRIRRAISTFFYRTSYTILLILLAAALAVTPGDHIYQTLSNRNLGNVFVVAGVYIGTALIALFIYASRLYTNRTTLAIIPRTYLPIQKSEVGKKVRRIIEANWRRSALVAWEGRPRDLRGEVEVAARQRVNTALRAQLDEKRLLPLPEPDVVAEKHYMPLEAIPFINPDDPPWGAIAHKGWSSPSHVNLPGLHFETVICELPNLLEAKAVGLAPGDPAFKFLGQGNVQAPPDAGVVALLQRERWMGLREYLERLAGMELLREDNEEEVALGESGLGVETEEFLRMYEYARFSVSALSEAEFEALMMAFSRVLSMVALPSEQAVALDGQRHHDSPVSNNLVSSRPDLQVASRSASQAQSFSLVLRRPVFQRTASDNRSIVESLASSSQSIIRYDVSAG